MENYTQANKKQEKIILTTENSPEFARKMEEASDIIFNQYYELYKRLENK